ncbi:hypothetical protein COE78_22105 [Bacillus pseudomycoides]|nr:hypothetical protein COE78_22105 [Bacillus pseudomycoides]
MNDVWHGDAESIAKWGTNAFMELGLGWIGDKGISKVGKVTTLGEGVNLAKFSEGISSVSNQIPLKDRFSFAGGTTLKSNITGNTFTQAKDTFLFFDKFKSHPNSVFLNNKAAEHLFHGNFNRRGEPGGYHHESMMGGGKVKPGSESPPNRFGVYSAEIEVNAVLKESPSTFFPKHWDRTQVMEAIHEAYSNKRRISGKLYSGKTSEGMEIRFVLINDKIITVYPMY